MNRHAHIVAQTAGNFTHSQQDVMVQCNLTCRPRLQYKGSFTLDATTHSHTHTLTSVKNLTSMHDSQRKKVAGLNSAEPSQSSCNYNVDTRVTVQRTTSRLSINARHTTQRSTSYCCSLQQYGIYRPSTTPWSHYKIFNIIIFTPKCDIFKNYQKTVIRKYFIEHFN